MGETNRLTNRVFHVEGRGLDQDDDNLAPVVLAIDAVQQLMEAENRNKMLRGKHTKNGSSSDIESTSKDQEKESDETKGKTDLIEKESPRQSSSIAGPEPTSSETVPVNQEPTVTNEHRAKVERQTKNEYETKKVISTEVEREENNFQFRTNPIVRVYNQNNNQNNREEYEFIPKSVILDVYSNDPEVKRFLKQLPKISNEFGFNEQDYKCYSCRRPIGMVFGQSRLCHFDGHHYCSECHLGEKSVIPARILCNWDFNKYLISKRNQHFLTLISNEPMFELKLMAPLLYKTCPELMEIEELRCQAFFIRSYCFTCAQDSISFELTKLVWPREHLIKQTDLYSLEDLMQIKSGTLKQVLKNVISFGRQHVLSCVLCCQKGFICELCKSSQIIYPFDSESVHRCTGCQSIYHKTCFKSKLGVDSCPRCQRLKARRNN